jgi:aminomethyltransferase
MVANTGDGLFVVVNAARKDHDFRHLAKVFGADLHILADRALLALQGPEAEAALAPLAPFTAAMRFMDWAAGEVAGVPAFVSRSGYTGEDGFEVSVPEGAAVAVARALLAQPGVLPVGLGARDSLRLEAGLCLYGHEIDTGTDPVEAGLEWAIQKVRRAGGARAGGFPGAERILGALAAGPVRRRVGLRPEGRAPVRDGAALFAAAEGGEAVGIVTSGSFGATLGAPVAMGYVPAGLAAPGTVLHAEVRGRRLPVSVVPLPFVPNRFKR